MVMLLITSVKKWGEEVHKVAPGTKEHLISLYDWGKARGTFVAERTFMFSLSLINACARFDDINKTRQKDVRILPDSVQSSTVARQTAVDVPFSCKESDATWPASPDKIWKARKTGSVLKSKESGGAQGA